MWLGPATLLSLEQFLHFLDGIIRLPLASRDLKTSVFVELLGPGVPLKSKLVGGFNHLEKYLSMGRIIPYIMENKKYSKPPTR